MSPRVIAAVVAAVAAVRVGGVVHCLHDALSNCVCQATARWGAETKVFSII